jgi:hypothetical protein
MYLTAHRPTVDDVDAWPGINAYLYLHGRTWQGSPPPNLPAARFERRHELIEHHPGRRIRSFLDLVGPDDANSEELARAVAHVAKLVASGLPRPWVHLCGRCQATFLVEPALDGVWHAELYLLWQEAELLWLNATE